MEKLYINCDNNRSFKFDKPIEGCWRLLYTSFDRPFNVPEDIVGDDLYVANDDLSGRVDYLVPAGYYTPTEFIEILNNQKYYQQTNNNTDTEWKYINGRFAIQTRRQQFEIFASPYVVELLGLTSGNIDLNTTDIVYFNEDNTFTSNILPEYLFVFSNEDQNKSIVSNNFFTSTFIIEDNNGENPKKFGYKNDINYNQKITLNHPIRNIKWKIFDRDNNEYTVNNLILILEKIKKIDIIYNSDNEF